MENGAHDHNRQAVSLMRTHPREAISHFASAIEQGYSEPDCYCNLSVLLIDQKQFQDALTICTLGLQVCGESAPVLGNLGVALSRLGLFEEALAAFQRQATLLKASERPWANLGIVLLGLGRVEEAKHHFKKAIQRNPNDRDSHGHLSLALLLEGNYRAGFREYEMRLPAAAASGFPQPVWQGERLQNKRILLTAEQGVGDVIQFARYGPLVRERGGQVILEIPPTLARLFEWTTDKFETVIAGQHKISFDLHCPLLSLPLRCRTDVDSIPPPQEIKVPAEMKRRWTGIVGETDRPRVALVWAGNPLHIKDAYRSIPLPALTPLFEHPSIRWFSLQVGPAAGQIAANGWSDRILDVSPLLNDFAETAGALSKMDLLITVDTSVAHLAGTLRVPVWLLLPFVPDWRWLLKRDDSPWYPSMRLFRQPARGDWQSVINAVAAELSAISAENLERTPSLIG
jgi:hypothetical protein